MTDIRPIDFDSIYTAARETVENSEDETEVTGTPTGYVEGEYQQDLAFIQSAIQQSLTGLSQLWASDKDDNDYDLDDSVSSQIQDLTPQAAAAQETTNTNQADLDSKSGELESLKSKYATAKGKAQELQGQIDTKTAEKTRLSEENGDLDSKKSQYLYTDLPQKTKELHDFEEQSKKLGSDIILLNTQLQELLGEYNHYDKTISDPSTQDHITELEGQINDLKAEIEAKEKEKLYLDDTEIPRVKQEINGINQDIDYCNTKIDENVKSMQAIDNEIQPLQSQIDGLDIAGMESQLGKLGVDIDTIKASAVDTADVVQDLVSQVNETPASVPGPTAKAVASFGQHGAEKSLALQGGDTILAQQYGTLNGYSTQGSSDSDSSSEGAPLSTSEAVSPDPNAYNKIGYPNAETTYTKSPENFGVIDARKDPNFSFTPGHKVGEIFDDGTGPMKVTSVDSDGKIQVAISVRIDGYWEAIHPDD